MSVKYSIAERGGQFMVMRGAECREAPNNAELQFWQEREAYRKALDAAQRVLWMAEKYAEGDSFDSENYEDAVQDIGENLAGIGA